VLAELMQQDKKHFHIGACSAGLYRSILQQQQQQLRQHAVFHEWLCAAVNTFTGCMASALDAMA